ATTATATFTTNTTNFPGLLMIDGSAAALRVNATIFTASATVSGGTGQGSVQTVNSNPGCTIVPPNPTCQQVDGFGRFNLTVDLVGGTGNGVGTITVSLSATGTSW